MKSSLDVHPQHLAIVKEILRQHLPIEAKVWAFGSRATATARKNSDLDLAIDMGKPLDIAVMAAIVTAFEESGLPYKVDVIDWNTVSDDFKQRIANDRILISH